MIVSECLGLPVEKITVVQGDTDDVPKGTGTFGSKSTQIGGMAARGAAESVVEAGRNLAADYLEASATDVVLDVALGRFHVVGAPAPALSWAEVAERAAADERLDELRAQHDFQAPPTFPFGVHIAVVEVDVETGKVELERLVAVDDAGTLINPLIAEGQVHGGVAIGVAQALYEDFVYDDDGNPLTSTFVGYGFPSAADLPSWEAVEMETPTPSNALGVKGIGESGTIGSTPAVQQRRARRAGAVRRSTRRPALQRRERLACAPGREGMTRIALTVNGARTEADVEPRQLLVYFLREHARAQGHERRLRHDIVRRVHRPPGRRVGQVVHRARGPGRRQRRHDDRGPRDRRRPPPRAAGIPRAARAPVRLLHAGLRHGDGLVAAGAARDPSEEEIRRALEGNLCRCTGYHNIVRAVQAAARAGA